ncbi:MAG: ABC transporter ATP-binding protein [Acetilactobacillus jinshanensis]
MSKPKRQRRATHFWKTTWRLVKYMKPWKWLMTLAGFTIMVSMFLQIVAPSILGNATTVIYSGIKKGHHLSRLGHTVPTLPIDYSKVGHILMIVALMYVIAVLNSIVEQVIINYVSQKAVYSLRRDFKRKMEYLPVSFYDTHDNGDIMSRAINDMDDISTMLQTNVSQFMISIIIFVGVLVMMFKVSFILTLVALCTIPLSGAVVGLIVPKSQRYFISQQHHLGLLNNQVEENFAGHDVIKTFNRENTVVNHFKKENERYYQSAWRAQFYSIFMFPITIFIKNLDYVFVAIIGGIEVINGELPLGNVQAFLQYTNMFSQPITQLANLTSTIQYTVASAERVFEILDEPEMSTKQREIPDDKTGDVVDFQHVNFRYLPDRPLIHDFNLSVKPGSTIAIVGPTGAGKSTMINLLERFYDVDSGHIRIDGVDTRNLSRPQLRRNMAMVLQNTWLFKGTVFDNIRYGNLKATKHDVAKAAKLSHADDFIRRLPNGYETKLNENASNISQGQRQLLTIARAFVANPRIMILDEATSSVDTKTESMIQDAMDRLVKNRTSFVIAHRLSTIQNADDIIVMNHGHIVETGTHNELLKKHGFYYRLYNSQFIGVN